MCAKNYITQFDSSTSMLYALGNALHGRPFNGAGVVPGGFEFIPKLLDFLPFDYRQRIYRWSGWGCALPERKLKAIRAEEISEWVVRQYPRRRYPAMMIGSSNGAAIHLAAAMGIPWLPQTFLVAARRKIDPDQIEADIEWGRRAARAIRENNPELKMNQMHDPVQDRLMIAVMGYFRIKRVRLGEVYERFIRENLEPGGTLIILDNRLRWPMIQAGKEHTFQVGGLGGLGGYEYLQGSPRVEAFLRAHGSPKKSWPLPGTVFEGPESEWGFHPPLGEDVDRFAEAAGYRRLRAVFEEPEDFSQFVAELYRNWYEKKGMDAARLLVECFALIEPWMTLKTRSVPFWMAFNTRPSLRAVEAYLRNRSFEEIYMILMSNGVQGIDQVAIGEWKRVLRRAYRKGEFLGVNEKKYPLDLSSFVLYPRELKKKMSQFEGVPETLTLEELDQSVQALSGHSKVVWEK